MKRFNAQEKKKKNRFLAQIRLFDANVLSSHSVKHLFVGVTCRLRLVQAR